MTSPAFRFWALGNLAVALFWGNVLSGAAHTGARSLFLIAFLGGFLALLGINRLSLSGWLGSIVFFSAMEPPTWMMLSPVSVGGLTLLPYKFLPLVGAVVFIAHRIHQTSQGRRPVAWATLSWAGPGIAILVGTGMLSAILSLSPVAAGGKAFTLALGAVSLVATASLVQASDQRFVAKVLGLALGWNLLLVLLQAVHYFGIFPDSLLWFRFEEGQWLRFGVVGPQRAYGSFHNPNYLPLWSLMVLLVLRHLGEARARHYGMVIVLSLLSLSASGLATTLFSLMLLRVPHVLRRLLFVVLLIGPLIALPVIRALPLPDTISTGSGRQYIAWAAANAVYSSPLVGIGLGILDVHFERFGPPNYYNSARVAHNFTWETLVSTGLLGVLGLYLIYGVIFQQSRDAVALQCALLSFLVWGQWQPGLTWMPIWIMLGFLLGWTGFGKTEPYGPNDQQTVSR